MAAIPKSSRAAVPFCGVRHLAAVLICWCAALTAHAHPFHASYAEADYRRETRKLEVAIRVFTDDIEAALTARSREKISLAKTAPAQLDQLLLAYVQSTFTIVSRDGTKLELSWVGRESKAAGQHLWIYVEGALSGAPDGARIGHRVLQETFSDQLNSLRLRDLGPPPREIILLFTPTDSEKTVEFARNKSA